MATRPPKYLLAAIAALGFTQASPAQTTTLFQQDFNGVSVAPLNGAVPSIRPSGSSAVWTANAGWTLAGVGTANTSAWLPYVPASGVYALTLDVAIASASSSEFFALALNQSTGTFSTGSLTSSNTNARGQLQLFGDGDWSVYGGPGLGSLVASSSDAPFANTQRHATMTLIVNKTGTNTLLDAYVNGTQLDLNGASNGYAYSFSAGLSITGIGFGKSNIPGTVDNFQFQSITPPTGANYFVAPPPLGSDTNAGTSATVPFATINKALSVAGSGKTIAVASGTYSYVDDNRVRTSETQVIGYGPLLPVITSEGNTVNGGSIYLHGAKFLVFDHLKITKGFQITATSTSSLTENITIRNCELDGGGGGYAFYIRNGAKNISVDGNHIHHWRSAFFTPNYGTYPSCDGISVTDNVVEYFSEDAAQFGHWDNVLFDHNVIRYMVDPTGDLHNDGLQFYGPTHHAVVSNNIIAHSGNQLTFVQTQFGEIDDLLVQNNLYYDCNSVAIQSQGATNARYISNTFYQTKDGSLWLTKGPTTIPAATDTIVANNVFASTTSSPFAKFDGAATAYEDYNLATSGGGLTGAHDTITATPGFVSPAAEDFHPASAGNSLVGTGTALYASAADLADAPRANPPARGAYEKASATFTALMPYTWEAESAQVIGSSDNLTDFYETAANGGAGEKLNSAALGAYVAYRVPIANPGSYHVKLRAKKASTRGQFQLVIDGANQGAVQDLYSASSDYAILDLGTKIFGTTGWKEFRFKITGKNSSSSGYDFGLDYIQAYPQVQEVENIYSGTTYSGGARYKTAFVVDKAASDQVVVISTGQTIGNALDYKLVPIIQAGSFSVKVRVKRGSNLGQFQLSIDGVNVGGVQDLYAAADAYAVLDFGTQTFASAGNHNFKFTITGKNTSSSDYQLALDSIEVGQ